jgi:hypothetical protein
MMDGGVKAAKRDWAPRHAAAEGRRETYRKASTLEELLELMGDEATAKLILVRGGTRILVPEEPHPGDLLSQIVGDEAAARLAAVFRGDRIEIPNPINRRLKMIELRRQGKSIDAIALAVGVTRRRVFQVLAEAQVKKGARPAEPQSNLK